MNAKLRISRLAGWARHRVVLDGVDVASLGRGGSVEMEVPSGTHTLQLLYRFGLASPVETFTVRAGETAAFACRSRPLRIALERTGHREEEGSSEQERELSRQIQAAQNQPGLLR
jgi:hypothetical protein